MRKNEQLIGAAAERKAILRKLRKIHVNCAWGEQFVLEILEKWILARDDRYNARKGGLGRKRNGV